MKPLLTLAVLLAFAASASRPVCVVPPGLGHMYGEQGLLAMLAHAGYAIERAPR